MTFKTDAIIINKCDVRDYDRLYTLYTAEHGKLRATASGVRKISSKLAGSLELFTYATFTIAKGRGTDRIATVDVRNNFRTIIENLDATASAMYCLEITDQLVKEGESDQELFSHLRHTLEALVRGEGRPVDIAHRYILNLLSLLGYHQEESANVQVVLQEHLDRPLRSQPFFNFLLGVA